MHSILENINAESNNNDETKTWTIRKVDSETIERTKDAARKSGMKIGAWVDLKLKEATCSTLNEANRSDLATDLDHIVNALDQLEDNPYKNQIDRIESELIKFSNDMMQLVQGHNNILLSLREIRKAEINT